MLVNVLYGKQSLLMGGVPDVYLTKRTKLSVSAENASQLGLVGNPKTG
jgi:hypothetical protein